MSIVRSYFSKNNTLIDGNLSNNSQNPVTEISYGGWDKRVSRFIFDVDLSSILKRIDEGSLNPSRIVSHTLRMTNTISNAEEYLGKKSYSSMIDRASSFELDIFNVAEDWDEGSGYDFTYDSNVFPNVIQQASNWYEKKSGQEWFVEGGYDSGVTEIIGTQRFEKGSEDIAIDVTEYINERLGVSGNTELTGSTYGLGIKFTDDYEALEMEFRQAVAFYARRTNTWFEPYIETVIDDTVTDDRNYFFLDKSNELYLYSNFGGSPQNVVVNHVNIYDYQDNHVTTISGDSIVHVSKGVYKITLTLDSAEHVDAVLYSDEWDITFNGKNKIVKNQFYLISENNYYDFNNEHQINFDNYFFYFWGIGQGERMKCGGKRKVKLVIKELYPNQSKFVPLDIEYRLFTRIGGKYEIEVVPFTKVNRLASGYEFDVDTEWLVPQDYYLQIRMKNGHYYENKQTLSFSVVSDDIKP